ncbi:MAG: hypothetical protein M0R17_07060 [Candidatus Omnitrophica bacterium]|jgi:hypothetical protein|nr:hypothetical protein [Candidatus Omnitrophota bacterium]
MYYVIFRLRNRIPIATLTETKGMLSLNDIKRMYPDATMARNFDNGKTALNYMIQEGYVKQNGKDYTMW